MIKDIAYKKETLSDLFALSKGDVDSLIESEALPIYSTLDKKFIGFIPSLSSCFVIEDKRTATVLAEHVEENNYIVALEDSIISISSTNPHMIPATSFLFNNKWWEKAAQILTIDESFNLLITNRKDIPFYCGHEKFINRLAENMSGDIYIVNAFKWRDNLGGSNEF